ncbi:hypothetical protein PFISCL1PPCAC_17301, partial [Pristionchus fissidentatus]
GISFSHMIPPLRESPHPIPSDYYETEVNKVRWVIPKCYTNLRQLGEGAYGVVCTAEYGDCGERVAIKKFSRPFQSTIHAKRTHRELKLLRSLAHENVLEMIDVFSPDIGPRHLREVYFVSILFGSDLQNIIKIQRLADEQIQLLIYQVLRGLKYIHSAGIIHRDLKPSNIAVNERCDVKILDFGLARCADLEMTGYVATRWYRAPEIMLNWMHYTHTVDIWSVGCILAELITGKALFPGDDHIDQLTRIMKVVGTPNEEFLNKIQSEEARNYIRNLPFMPRLNFLSLFPNASRAAVDLLDKMLVLDPDYRISVVDAIAHEFIREYSIAEEEPVAGRIVTTDEEESRARTIIDWKESDYQSPWSNRMERARESYFSFVPEIVWSEMQGFRASGRALSDGFPHKLSCEEADD